MKYYLGVDGGASGSKYLLADENLNIICEMKGNPTNFLVRGSVEVSGQFLDRTVEIIQKNNIEISDLCSIVIGTTGAGRTTDAKLLKDQVTKDAFSRNLVFSKIEIVSDARIALEGAFSGNPGCILIAGTGSIMFGKDEIGNIHRIGGYGRYIGDEGSGYRIGRRALNAVARAFDSRAKQTRIADLLSQEFSISSPEELITAVYSNNFEIPSVTPLVFDAAESGDVTAQKILEDEADELLLHITAMRLKINVHILKISLIGSILTTPNYFSYLFNEKIVRNFIDVKIIEPEKSPQYGAVLMAKEL